MRYPLMNHSTMRYTLPPRSDASDAIWQSALNRLRDTEPEETRNTWVHLGRTKQRPHIRRGLGNYYRSLDTHVGGRLNRAMKTTRKKSSELETNCYACFSLAQVNGSMFLPFNSVSTQIPFLTRMDANTSFFPSRSFV